MPDPHLGFFAVTPELVANVFTLSHNGTPTKNPKVLRASLDRWGRINIVFEADELPPTYEGCEPHLVDIQRKE